MSSRPKKAFPLRIEPALWSALERCAAADFRSVNAEIEVLLREALARRGLKVAPPEERRRGRPPKEEKE
ncbi:toxin-antitoxin system HicB family antitoxin [Sphingosinicella sp. CPCC 101087]|uniref:toxin-antitoxin system HicB family antitoxin n=1 Tax=Sphingosinicella sp. CPCC 101087 TaxID=2497754 RepID=UPI00101E033C|nr:toxin-antitoxin system HicB family antitoxin [Sphingosinicella sp. CPCC 101087]